MPINIMLKGEARYLYGTVDYDGGTWGGTPLKIKNIPDYMWEARGMVGYDLYINDNIAITPYVGYGYRYLNDNAHVQYAGGYMREANYLYNPIGLELTINNGNNKYGFKVESDSWISGRQLSHLSDIDPLNDDAVNEQKNGGGYRFSVNAQFNVSGIILKFEGYQINWDILKSEMEDVYYHGVGQITVNEPENHSSETGFSFGVIF
jgi:hypothetical protein